MRESLQQFTAEHLDEQPWILQVLGYNLGRETLIVGNLVPLKGLVSMSFHAAYRCHIRRGKVFEHRARALALGKASEPAPGPVLHSVSILS